MKDKLEQYKEELLKAIDNTPLLKELDKEIDTLQLTEQIESISKAHYEENAKKWVDPWLFYSKALSAEVSAIKQRGNIYRPVIMETIKMQVTKHCGDWT